MRQNRKERWLPIQGYEGFYEVSNCGRVRSLSVIKQHGGYRPRKIKGRILKTGPTPNKIYASACLYGEGKSKKYKVHVLVARHFVPNPTNAKIVRHKNDNPKNNRDTNLAWGTRKDNARDAQLNNRLGHKLTRAVVSNIKAELKAREHRYRRQGDGGKFGYIVKKYGISISTVRQIHSGERWGHVS